MNGVNASSSSGPVNTSTGEEHLDVSGSVWPPIDYSILFNESSTIIWPQQMDIQPPFNDTVPNGLHSYPDGTMNQSIRSTEVESVLGGNVGGNVRGNMGGNVRGNVGGPRAGVELTMLRPRLPDEGSFEVRREKQFVLHIAKIGLLWRQAELTMGLEVHGATTGTPFVSACHKCCTRVPSAPPSSSLFDFAAKGRLVGIAGGVAQVAFRFRCLPFHHGTTDREYRLTATIWDSEGILATRTFSNGLRIVHHLTKVIPIAVLPSDSVVVGTSVDSEESRGAPPNARTSDGKESGTSAGESQCSIPTQPSYTSAQSPSARLVAPTPRTDEQSELEREGGGLPAFTAQYKHPVLSHMNPRRGSMNGGEDIFLIVKNLSPTMALYARFGAHITPTTLIADGVLSCVLPAAERPGVVHVTLCQEPSVHEDSYGKSLVSFEYQCDTSKAHLASWFNAQHGSHGVGTGTTSS